MNDFPVPAHDRRRVQPTRDADRVLGQIARGEVVAGPEGARRIAAKHQGAYGNTVWGPTARTTKVSRAAAEDLDAAWADALTALTGGNTR